MGQSCDLQLHDHALCMWLAGPTLVYVLFIVTISDVTLGAQSNVWAGSSRPKQFLMAEPAQRSNSSAEGGQDEESVESSCHKENIFEDTLDKLAYALFVDPPMIEDPDINYVRQMLEGAVVGPPGASVNEAALVPLKAVASRLQGWWNAVLRVQRFDASHNLTAHAKAKAAKRIAAHSRGNDTGIDKHDTNAETHVAKEYATSTHTASANANETTKAKVAKEYAKSTHTERKAKVLPTACASSLPANDPYWSQIDSYWVCDGHNCVPYNECRYSNGCKKEYTNGERVASLRATLQATHRFLNDQGVTYMLFGGSVIGAYRCKDVLPWDLDADVVVMQDQIPHLLKTLAGAPNGTGYKNQGRSIDLALYGLSGFTLMEKHAGCCPLAIVDQATGFFVDVFPMRPMHTHMYSPWWNGKTGCNAPQLFNGCQHHRCDYWSYANTLPASVCQINNAQQACAHDLQAFVYEYYGPSIEEPDRPVRD